MTLPEAAGLALAFVARLITGAQGHWHGSTPKAEQRIYFANHQSHFDWVLIWAALPHDLRAVTRPIAARDYWTATPLKHWITREIFNAVYVSRQRARTAAARRGPARAADGSAPPRRLARHLPGGNARPRRRPGAVQVGPVRARAGVPGRPADPGLDRQRPARHAQGRSRPVPILCTVVFGAPIALAPARSGAPSSTAPAPR
jgi:1-acyl-sn-glycerol-3-phosphate acyltransferase